MRRLSTPVVGVVGGGVAGTLTAVHLLRTAQRPVRIVLVERRRSVGRGIAYATTDDAHLLNVPMERLSAFSADPHHFARWAADALGRPLEPGSYLPRRVYGDYVQAVLGSTRRATEPLATVEVVADEVVDLDLGAAGGPVGLVLRDGAPVACDAVVLALGNLPGPRPDWLIDDPRVVADPWSPAALEAPRGARTLLVGTGLTAVDVALSLTARDPEAEVVATSSTGRLPFAQLPGRRDAAPPPSLPDGPLTLGELIALVRGHIERAESEGYDWRDAIDGLRPAIPELWRKLAPDDRRCLVERHAREWELRRHRMAPEVARRIAALRAEGQLRLTAGRVVAMRATPRAIEVEVTHPERPRVLTVDRVVSCAGPCADVTRSPDPLVRRLLARGLARPDALKLGLCAGAHAELRAADASLEPRVRLLGPPLRGELWETTAIAEIRLQAERLALLLARELELVAGSRSGRAV